MPNVSVVEYRMNNMRATDIPRRPGRLCAPFVASVQSFIDTKGGIMEGRTHRHSPDDQSL